MWTHLTEIELFPSPGWKPASPALTDPLTSRSQFTLQGMMGNNECMALRDLDGEGLHCAHGATAGFMRLLVDSLWWGARCGGSSLTQLMVVKTPINNPPDRVFYYTRLQLKAHRECINQYKWKTDSEALKVGGEPWLAWDAAKPSDLCMRRRVSASFALLRPSQLR